MTDRDAEPLILLPALPGPTAAAELLDPAAIEAELSELAQAAAEFAAKAAGAGTARTYGSAWRAYAAWCRRVDRDPLGGDPGLIALYLAKRARQGLVVSSLVVARAAIRAQYRLHRIPIDMDDPRIALVMAGIARDKGTRPKRQAAPAVLEVLRRLLGTVPAANTPKGAAPALATRHRAMLLIGYYAGLRRSELAALTIGDIGRDDERGLTVLIRRSKTDAAGAGHQLALWGNAAEPEICPVAAVEAWLEHRALAAD